MIFLFMLIIVLGIVIMSIINTISTSILERTREIGTIRALGLKRSGVVSIFCVEGALLVFLGSLLGIILTLLFSILIEKANINYIPPNFSRPVQLGVKLLPLEMILRVFLFTLLSIIPSFMISRISSKGSIVESLNRL